MSGDGQDIHFKKYF